MKYVAAIVMGFLSGYLIYLVSGLFLPIAVQATLLVVGWAASGYFLLRGARAASKVITRGFLLGATEWLLIVVAVIIHALYTTEAQHLEWAAIRVTVAAFMALLCLACFAVVHFWRREMKPERSERASSSM